MLDGLLSSPEPPGVRRPTVSISFGGGAGGGGLGGLAGAAASAVGLGGGSEDPWLRSLVSVAVETALAPAVDVVEIVLSGDSQAPEVAVGDQGTVALGHEDGDTPVVFTGRIDRVRRRLDGTVAIGVSDSGAELARLRVNQGYEQQSAGDIVRDLAGRAGVDTGTVEDGVDLAFYAVDDRGSVYARIASLARISGYIAYVSAEGRLCFGPAPSGDPTRTFNFAVDILGLEVVTAPPDIGAVTVVGGGAAGSEGQDAWAWQVKDPAAVTATAGTGAPERSFSVSGLRSGEAATAAAAASSDGAAAGALAARLLVPGAPEVVVGGVLAVAGAAAPLNGEFLVRRVRHRFDKRVGFTTRLDLVGAGKSGGSLLPGGLL